MAGRPPALAQRFAPQPGDRPDHSHGCRGQELLEVCACEPQRPTPTEINISYPLRQAALHPCPQRILGFALRCLLALPRGLEHLMVGLWADRELARGTFGPGARAAGWTDTTGRGLNAEAHDGVT